MKKSTPKKSFAIVVAMAGSFQRRAWLTSQEYTNPDYFDDGLGEDEPRPEPWAGDFSCFANYDCVREKTEILSAMPPRWFASREAAIKAAQHVALSCNWSKPVTSFQVIEKIENVDAFGVIVAEYTHGEWSSLFGLEPNITSAVATHKRGDVISYEEIGNSHIAEVVRVYPNGIVDVIVTDPTQLKEHRHRWETSEHLSYMVVPLR